MRKQNTIEDQLLTDITFLQMETRLHPTSLYHLLGNLKISRCFLSRFINGDIEFLFIKWLFLLRVSPSIYLSLYGGT